MNKVLLVEDDEIIAKIIQYYLNELKTYEVFWAQNAGEALSLIRKNPDIILMDIMLPDVNGLDLCVKLREITYIPIIFISAIDDEETIIKALNIGGDDYLVKPFNNQILHAKIQSNLRRINFNNLSKDSLKYEYKYFALKPEAHAIIKNEKYTLLAPIEFDILMTLITNTGNIVTIEQLFQAVWNHPNFGDTRALNVHIFNLRKKLGDNQNTIKYIHTIRGKGYIFQEEIRGCND